jgi:arylsulfatase A
MSPTSTARRPLLLSVLLVLVILLAPLTFAADAARPPNVVILFADDMGYADLACYGGPDPTPNLDRLAKNGVRFTDFYVAQAVCSASRAALLTGRYSQRVGIKGALDHRAKNGISQKERTLGQLLKSRGYATAIYGKWHLGHLPEFSPLRHGFDEYFGLPYSNDMWPKHPTGTYPDLPLMDGEKVAQLNPDQSQLTTWYTEHAVSFIERNKEKPFFLYVPYAMPHVPLFVSDKFKGKSTARGIYGDVIMEIDWSAGQIAEALERNGLTKDTLVIFMSDNGPWLSYGDHAGSKGPLREGKATVFEGGVRVPMIASWPGHIPAGRTCTEPAMTIDLVPTVSKFVGLTREPSDPPLDGLDISPLLMGAPGAKSPHEALYFFWGDELQAIRSGQFKLHLAHDYTALVAPGGGGKPGKLETRKTPQALYDLAADIGESRDVSAQHPQVVAKLMDFAKHAPSSP